MILLHYSYRCDRCHDDFEDHDAPERYELQRSTTPPSPQMYPIAGMDICLRCRPKIIAALQKGMAGWQEDRRKENA